MVRHAGPPTALARVGEVSGMGMPCRSRRSHGTVVGPLVGERESLYAVLKPSTPAPAAPVQPADPEGLVVLPVTAVERTVAAERPLSARTAPNDRHRTPNMPQNAPHTPIRPRYRISRKRTPLCAQRTPPDHSSYHPIRTHRSTWNITPPPPQHRLCGSHRAGQDGRGTGRAGRRAGERGGKAPRFPPSAPTHAIKSGL